MLCELLRLMSRLVPLILLLRLLLLILLVPLLILLLMRGLPLSLTPRLILLLLRLMPRLIMLLLRLMLRLPLIRRATFTVALAASAAIVASTSPAPPAASGFEASGQGMAALGPVRAPVKLLHANETILQFGLRKICFQSKISLLESIRGGETIQNIAANLLIRYFNVVILHIQG